MFPVTNADLRERTAAVALTLDLIFPVAMLFIIVGIAGTQARARAGADLLLSKLAFDSDSLFRSAQQHIDAGRSQLS